MPLSELIDGDIGRMLFEQSVTNFKCKRNRDIEVFLKEKAIDLHKKDITRTFLIVKKHDADSRTFQLNILGYFTLSIKSLEFSDGVSKSKIKELTSNKNSESGVGFLIGQFGKNDNGLQNVSGIDMMYLALEVIALAYQLVGGRFVFLDSKEIDSLVDFYKSVGFTELSSSTNKDGYLQMFSRLPVKKIQELVAG